MRSRIHQIVIVPKAVQQKVIALALTITTVLLIVVLKVATQVIVVRVIIIVLRVLTIAQIVVQVIQLLEAAIILQQIVMQALIIKMSIIQLKYKAHLLRVNQQMIRQLQTYVFLLIRMFQHLVTMFRQPLFKKPIVI